jgi:pre-mRNA-processing factor SLU7
MINPHNPEYITKRPWYLGESGPSLKHHAKQRTNEPLRLTEAEEILEQHKQKFKGKATHYRKVRGFVVRLCVSNGRDNSG